VKWAEDGVPLCATGEYSYFPKIVSDGEGGAIVAWEGWRNSSYNMYAQRVNAAGAILWTINGVPLCTASGRQESLQIMAVGGGGAIVTWMDSRNGNEDICAQRLSASGATLWTMNGVALCAEGAEQSSPQIVCDGAAGAIVVWQDRRSGNDDIYAQRVNGAGAVLWAADGIPLCSATENQRYPQLASDGADGAIVTWQDNRNGNYDIYAQRVDTTGAVQWIADGVGVCTATSDQVSSQITADGAGGVIVTWDEWRSAPEGIYAQRVNALGVPQWPADGVPISTVSGDRGYPRIISDGAMGAIVAWYRNRGENPGIWAQRVNSAGAMVWAADGVSICAASWDQWYPRIISDGAAGSIVTWADSRSGNDAIYAQRLNSSGDFEWPLDGVFVSQMTNWYAPPEVKTDGSGGVIAAWADYRNGEADIFAERVDASGSVQWMAGGVPICTATNDQTYPDIASDGASGAIIAWSDYRNHKADIFAQRLNASGATVWTANGVALCTGAGDHSYPRMISDGAGGAIVIWEDTRNGNYDIYAQRLNASGAALWTLNGVPLCAAGGSQGSPQIIADGAGGAIVTWEDLRSGEADIYAQRVNASGDLQWTANGVPLCTAVSDQDSPQIVSDDAGGAIVVWEDGRKGNDDIYAQRVHASGATLWQLDGVPTCTTSYYQSEARITPDGAGGAIVAWRDERGRDAQIFAQRMNSAGGLLWAVAGVPLCSATGDKRDPQVTTDGTGGAIVAWTDYRCAYLTYAQRVDAAGHVAPETATFLQTYSAALDGASIRIDWALSEIDEGVHFLVSRASVPDWKYVELEGAGLTQEKLSCTFIDTGCLPGTAYRYRVECEVKGTGRKILFETEAITMPALPMTLYQNHPNPFNPHTVIRFYLPEAQEVFLDVYDVAGERVATLAEGKREKGYYEVTWDGRNASGTVCSSGVYFSRLKAGKSTISRKMVITR
jgi:hypothetical protein